MSWQPWAVEYTEDAKADLKEIPRKSAGLILKAVRKYAQTGAGDVKHIEPRKWRLRKGNFRVFFDPQNEPRRLLVYQIAKRDESTYKG